MSAAHGSSPGARRGDRFKWLGPGKKGSHAQVAGGLRIESPGPWVPGMPAEAASQKPGSPSPPQGSLIPSPPSKLGAESESSHHGWGSIAGGWPSRSVAVTEGYTSPADGARRGRRCPHLEGEGRPPLLPASPRPGWWSSDAGSLHPGSPKPRRHSPAVTGDSQRAHQPQSLGHCGGRRRRPCRGGGARRRSLLLREAGPASRNHPSRRPEAPPPAWPRPAVLLEACLPSSCDAGPRPTRLQPLCVSIPKLERAT